MTKRQLKQLSDYELSELLPMMGDIRRCIKDYSHVTDSAGIRKFINQVDKIYLEISKEYEEREEN